MEDGEVIGRRSAGVVGWRRAEVVSLGDIAGAGVE